MTNWAEFTTYVSEHYKVMASDDAKIAMGFNLGNGRTQTVFLWRQNLMGGAETWVQIESPIGPFDKKTCDRVLRSAENAVVGGIGCTKDLITYRHAFPLENFDPNEFERPVILVASTADRIEQEVFAKDAF